MAASSLTHIVLWVGDSPVLPFTLSRGGNAIDLTGATVTFTWRETDEDGTIKLQYTKVEGGAGDAEVAFTTPASGIVTITPDPAETAALLDTASYVWDLEVIESDGTVTTFPRDTSGDPVLGAGEVVHDVTYSTS